MSYYVYELFDPRDNAVFYVGKGRGGRIHCHEIEARRGRQSRKCDVIRGIEAAGHRIGKHKVRQFDDEQEAYDFEADLIDQYGLESLTNIIPGGGIARNFGQTAQSDRQAARIIGFCFNRTAGGKIVAVSMFGHTINLREFIEANRKRAREIIERRGLDWLNNAVRRHHVVFEPLPV